MRISPISNNNLYSQKKQTNPNFGARIDKSLVKQMISETSPLKNLEVKIFSGIVSLPALVVAKMRLTPETSSENKSENEIEFDVNSISSTDLYNKCMEQDEDGKTFLHKQLTPELIELLSEKLTPEQFENVFTTQDNSKAGPVQRSSIKKLLETINDLEMPVKSALNIAKANYCECENSNLIYFWEYRLKKQEQMQSPVGAHVDEELYKRLDEGEDPIRVETTSEYFEELDVETAAKLFKTNSHISVCSEIDSEYLPYASEEDIKDVTIGAQRGSEGALHELCNAINTLPDEKRELVIDKMIAGIDNDSLLTQEHTETIRVVLGDNAFEKLHRKQDEDGSTIISNSVYKIDRNETDLEDTDFFYHFNELRKVNSELLEDVILTKNSSGHLDITARDSVMHFIHDEYKDRPDIIKKIYMNQDEDGYTYLHYAEAKIAEEALGLFNDEDLAEILSIKNNNGKTPMRTQKIEYNNGQIFEDKIIELATDSDLSIDKSISLLEANNMAPQIVEFLKLQKSDLNGEE